MPAALDSVAAHPQLRLILVGDETVLKRQVGTAAARFGDRIVIQHASETIEMHESPAKALRSKKDSSMRVAIDLVKDGVAAACVSAGNTGALMAIAKFVLKTLPGIDRPAIIATVPAMTGHTHVLDLGANVDCTAEHLYQFAVMGHELVRAVEDKDQPRSGCSTSAKRKSRAMSRSSRPPGCSPTLPSTSSAMWKATTSIRAVWTSW